MDKNAWNSGKKDSRRGLVTNRISFVVMTAALITAGIFLFADSTRAEHDIQTYAFEFSGSAQPQATSNFIIYNDGALYLKLKSYTPSGSTTNKPVIGFRKPGQYLCPARYDSFVDNPAVGISYGPYYMEAETYESYFYLNGGASSYTLEIEYRRQLIPNDTEPNDTTTEARDIGNLAANAHITGHLGYLGCVHDKKDYQRFGVTTSGDYLFNIQFDTPFREKTGCMVYFHLLDETAGEWILSYTGPQNASALGPKPLDTSHTYLLSMEASGCYDTIYEGGGTFVVGNKAGAYDVTLTSQQTPPTEPFAITDLTVKPPVLWPGESLNGKVFLQNYRSSPSDNIELILRVVQLSDNAEAAAKTYSLSLAANELRIFEFSLGGLLAPKQVASLPGGKYKIVAVAQTRDAAGKITNSSSREVGFEVNQHEKNIGAIINFIMLKTKKR